MKDVELKPGWLERQMKIAKQQFDEMPAWAKAIMTGGHTSPNNAEFGSFAYAAEAWVLSEGLSIPIKSKHPNLYQAMLDDFQESEAYVLWVNR